MEASNRDLILPRPRIQANNGGGSHGGHGGGSSSGSKKSSTTTGVGTGSPADGNRLRRLYTEPQPVVPAEGLPKTGDTDRMDVADGSAGNWNDGSSLCNNDGQKKDGRVRQDIEK
ncbi:MAG: hypothetical protein ACLR8P_02640 [Clostridium fessum]